jgi:hypothetical protein
MDIGGSVRLQCRDTVDLPSAYRTTTKQVILNQTNTLRNPSTRKLMWLGVTHSMSLLLRVIAYCFSSWSLPCFKLSSTTHPCISMLRAGIALAIAVVRTSRTSRHRIMWIARRHRGSLMHWREISVVIYCAWAPQIIFIYQQRWSIYQDNQKWGERILLPLTSWYEQGW